MRRMEDMKRRLITLIAAAFLVVAIALGGYTLSHLAPTAHAAYINPPGGGTCSWVVKSTQYHYTTWGPATFTDYVEFLGYYSGSFFCGEAQIKQCRYNPVGVYEASNTWDQIEPYGGSVTYWPSFNSPYYHYYGWQSAGSTACITSPTFDFSSGSGIVAQCSWAVAGAPINNPQDSSTENAWAKQYAYW
jgi:hypothetical protein